MICSFQLQVLIGRKQGMFEFLTKTAPQRHSQALRTPSIRVGSATRPAFGLSLGLV